MGSIGFGIGMGALSLAGGLAANEGQRANQQMRAATLEAQAENTRRQAAIARQRGQAEAREIDRRKIGMRREFNDAMGRNRSLLAAGNVAMDSGSALDVANGNINLFAEDLGENQWQKALKQWETSQEQKNAAYQASVLDSQASYLKSTAGNIGASLLSAAISALPAAAQGYIMAGGTFDNLFSTAGKSRFNFGGKSSYANGPGISHLIDGILG